MSHTPGPWRFQQDGSEPYWGVDMPLRGGDGYGSGSAMVYTSESDARLISAAPELLGACKAALKVIGLAQKAHPSDPFCVDCYDTGLSGPISDVLRTVISKAEGSSDDAG